MTPAEILASHLYWIAMGIAFTGGLIARRNFIDAFWFMLIMPIIYGFLYVTGILALGVFVAFIFPNLSGETLQMAVSITAAAMCFAIFVMQVRSMSRDAKGGPHGYSIGSRSSKHSIRSTSPTLQRLPTRKRWSG